MKRLILAVALVSGLVGPVSVADARPPDYDSDVLWPAPPPEGSTLVCHQEWGFTGRPPLGYGWVLVCEWE